MLTTRTARFNRACTTPLAMPLAAALLVGSAPAAAQTLTWPARTWHDVAPFPRVQGLADSAAQARVNAALARRDRAVHTERRECVDQAHVMAVREHRPSPGVEFTQTVRAAYLSPRYLSLEVHQSWYCLGPYPTNDSPQPVTFDLTTGREVVWDRALTADALAPTGADSSGASAVAARYVARYRGEAPDAPNGCKPDSFTRGGEFTFWIDRGAHGDVGLAVRPELAHVVEACSVTIVLPAAVAQRFVADSALRRELANRAAIPSARRPTPGSAPPP